MIVRLRKVTPELYRGSAPSPKDVQWLKDNLHIKKIVSLDKESGDLIDRTTQLLHIKHIMLPIEMHNLRKSLLAFLKHDLKKLFLDGGPTYVHCAAGKDRTGLAIALVKCKYFGKDSEDAIEEAKSLGFGLDVDPKVIKTFEKLIRSCKPSQDTNNVDIVGNEREYIGDNRDSFLQDSQRSSFSPYLSKTRQYPYDIVYNPINDQSQTRENYKSTSIKEHDTDKANVPQVGIYDNGAGISGAGPALNTGGFIYD